MLEWFVGRTHINEATGCIIWSGQRSRGGYGRLRLGGRRQYAHRAAWEAVHGPIPAGLEIRHVVCRTPACVNVAHLLVGTHAENMADKVRDGTSWRGEASPHARLTTHHVRVIRYLLSHRTMGQRAIASLFGISQVAVSYINTGRNWSHVTGDIWSD